MKQKLLLFLALLSFGMASAQTFTINNIVYEVFPAASTTVRIISSPSATGAVVLPATVVNSSITYNVTTIGDYAFGNNPSLTAVSIPNSVTTIGEYAFYDTGLTSVSIPDSVITIGNGAFYYITNLTSVSIGNSVTTIGDDAFRECTSLTSVNIPNSVTTIGQIAFYNTALTSVSIPNSVTTIGYAAFYYITNLTSVSIGNSVTTIGDYAFGDCTNLTTVSCDIVTPLTINSVVFYSLNQANCTLIVPAGSVAAYSTASVWQNFSPITQSNTWLGTTDSSWSTASNWSKGVVPAATDVTYIVSNGTNAPVLDTDFTIASTGKLALSGTGTLTIAPTKTLTIAGTADFGGQSVTLQSNATGTASIGTITGTLLGATNVTVQRYIPAGKRAFRFLSPSVTTSSTISANWQLATHITGATTATDGFDVTGTGNPSLYTYDNQVASGTGWTAIANTDATTLNAKMGYRLLIRGDRTPSLLTTTSTANMNAAVTLSATGALVTGTVVYDSSALPSINNTANTTTDSYSLVGNPYASPINWNTLGRSGLDDSYYTWDPNMGTAAQRGRYVAYNTTSGLSSNSSSDVDQYIQSGQAFMVKNTVAATPGSLTITEADKSNAATTGTNAVFRTAAKKATATTTKLNLQVYETEELGQSAYPVDAATAVFGEQFSANLEEGDVEKLTAPGENIAFFAANKKLAILAAPTAQDTDALLIKTIAFKANKNYTFKMSFSNFDTSLTPYLEDNFLNTTTELNPTQDNLVNINTTAVGSSYSENRFSIAFKKASTLGVAQFDQNSISVYPNPATNNEFMVNLPNTTTGDVSIQMYNMIGQQVYQITTTAQKTLNVQPSNVLPKGVYLVKINTKNTTSTTKITLQ